MAQQTINIGTVANDHTGDPLRDAFDKCNDNFTELYTGLTGLLDFKGSTDCSANPNYPAASKGDYYLVSVAGKIGGASGVVVSAGDSYFATADNAGGTQASVGTSWTVIQGNIAFTPVNLAGDTMAGALHVPDDAYDATTWNGSTEVPTKNAVRDKIETLAGGSFTAASTTEVLTGTDSSKGGTPDSIAALWEQGSNVASAGTVSLGEGGHFHITGTTTITDIDFATDKAGRKASLTFDGALTLTHNASTLILPGGANITTAAGDTAVFVSEGSDVVRCVTYQKASGAAVVSSGGGTPSGTSFPGSPSTDDKFYRTDRRIEYFYDGTRWLSTELLFLHFFLPGTFPLSATVVYFASFPTPGTYDIYVEELGLAADITSATPASNNFSVQFQKQTGSSAAVNMGSALATSGLTVNTWANVTAAYNTVVASTVNLFQIVCTRNGSGTGYLAPYFRYRLVG